MHTESNRDKLLARFGHFHATYGHGGIMATSERDVHGNQVLFRFSHGALLSNFPNTDSAMFRCERIRPPQHDWCNNQLPPIPVSNDEFKAALSEAALGLFMSRGAEASGSTLHLFPVPCHYESHRGPRNFVETLIYNATDLNALLPACMPVGHIGKKDTVTNADFDVPDGMSMSVFTRLESYLVHVLNRYVTARGDFGAPSDQIVHATRAERVRPMWVIGQEGTLDGHDSTGSNTQAWAKYGVSERNARYLLQAGTFEALACFAVVVPLVIDFMLDIRAVSACVSERHIPFDDDSELCVDFVYATDEWEKLYAKSTEVFGIEFDELVRYLHTRLTQFEPITHIAGVELGNDTKALNTLISDLQLSDIYCFRIDVHPENNFNPHRQADYVIGSFAPRYRG